MSKVRSSKIAIGIAWWAFVMLFAFGSAVVAEERQPDRQTAAQFLEDGLDAIADHASESARRIFADLIAQYPDSPEAARARRALATLDSGVASPDDRAAITADQVERTARYRHAFLIDAGDRVFFAEMSSTVGGRARSVIENQARWLKARPDLTVTVIGRADDGGGSEAARALSLQRAEAVRARLVASGMDAARIEVKAAAEEDRLALCKTPLCQAQNRNAEILINEASADSAVELETLTPAASRLPLKTSDQGASAEPVAP